MGGDFPVWNRDGRTLSFIGNDFKVYSVETSQLQAKGAVRPAVLFTACPETQPLSGALAGYPYDAGPDGRFLILCQPKQVSFVVTVARGTNP